MSRTTGLGKEPRDLYPTPQWSIDALAEHLVFQHIWPSHIYDIGSGDGRIGHTVHDRLPKAATHRTHLCRLPKAATHRTHLWLNDIVLPKETKKGVRRVQMDFLDKRCKLPPPRSCVLFVSNPPFSLKFEIIRKTVDLIDNRYHQDSVAVFLLSFMFFGSLRRAIWLQKNQPYKIIGMAPRLSFVKGSTDATEYIWAFWKSGRKKSSWFDMEIDPAKKHIARRKYDELGAP